MTQTILLIWALGTVLFCAIAFYFEKTILKFVAITALVVIASAVYFSLDGVKGWPAEEPNEVKGILASVVIVNPSSTDSGGIYISLFPTLPTKWYEYEYPREAPKTFFVEYSNDRAAQFELAKKAMEEGREVRINGIPPKNSSGTGQAVDGDMAEEIMSMISNMMTKMLPKEKDTYKPDAPAVEILAPVVPSAKGSNQ